MSARTAADPVADFTAAIVAAGIPAPDQITADGKLHRYPTSANGRDKNGWYILHIDNLPNGRFGCWSAGIDTKWRADRNNRLSPAQVRETKRQVRQRAAQRARERAAKRKEARERAAEIWAQATPADPTSGYLKAKGVGAHGVGQDAAGNVLVPVLDVHNVMHSLQIIAPDGTKRFLKNGAVEGCFFHIGVPKGKALNDYPTVLMAEGYATAATLHEATGLPVLIAFNSGNMAPVARAIHAVLPSLHIPIAADHDIHGVGREKAEQAAEVTGADVIEPADIVDWNDVGASFGLDVVAAAFAGVMGQNAHNQGNSGSNGRAWS